MRSTNSKDKKMIGDAMVVVRTETITGIETKINTKLDMGALTDSVLVDPELIVICAHCGKRIDQAMLRGISLICPSCGKPQNGQPHTMLSLRTEVIFENPNTLIKT